MMRLWGNTRRINKVCLRTHTHDWDVFGHPNWVCCRPGCMVRADDVDDPLEWVEHVPLPPMEDRLCSCEGPDVPVHAWSQCPNRTRP